MVARSRLGLAGVAVPRALSAEILRRIDAQAKAATLAGSGFQSELRSHRQSAIGGVGHLNNQLVALMIEEKNPLHPGGAPHLNQLLDASQRSTLAALPTAEPSQESVVASHLAYADAFLPRARAVAAAHRQTGRPRSKRQPRRSRGAD